MKRLAVFLGALLLTGAGYGAPPGPAAPSKAPTSIKSEIADALKRVGGLKMMEAGEDYGLLARGEIAKGRIDDFLRRREPEEILASGLSSGCGDYAAAFYGLLRKAGAELLYVDAAELSVYSLLDRDDGHAGVAVKDPESGRWTLVDPTNRRILSERWDPASKIYAAGGGRYWVGYAGRLEDYPYKDPAGLKQFYDKTLKSVPSEVWDRELIRLSFSAGASLVRPDGTFTNPRWPAFLKRYSGVYEKLGLSPKREAKIEITDGGPGVYGTCRRSGPQAWTCPNGQASAMSPSWFAYIERRVAREYSLPFPSASPK